MMPGVCLDKSLYLKDSIYYLLDCVDQDLVMLHRLGNMSPYMTSYIRNRTSDKSLEYTDSMWIFALAIMGQGTMSAVGGLVDKLLGARCTVLIGGLTMSFGVLMTHFAIVNSFAATIVTYGILFGFGVGIAYNAPLGCAMKWFPSHKGLVNGLIVSGFGAGAFIFDQVQTSYINPSNLKANATSGPNHEKYFDQQSLLDRVPNVFLLLGGVYAAMQVIGALLLTSPSGQQKQEVSVRSSLLQTSDTNSEEYTDCSVPLEEKDPKKILKTREFWTLWFMFLVNGQAVLFISTLYKTYGETFISDDRFLAVVGSFAAVFNGSGRIFWGYMADRFTFRKAMILQCSSMAFLFLTFILTRKTGPWMYFIWVCLMFGTFSGNFALFPTATAKSFGQKYFTLNYGLVFTSQIVSGAIGTLLAQNLSDSLHWFGIFCLVASFAVVGLLLAVSFNVKKPNGEDI